MSTAMVITTVITTDVDVEKVKTFTLEQIRDNDQSLLNNLLDRGVDAHVTTAILNIDEFFDYMQIRHRPVAPQPPAPPTVAPALAPSPPSPTVVDTDEMSELEFMAYTLQQLQNGTQAPSVALSEAATEAIEEEHIGEHLARHPFLY